MSKSVPQDQVRPAAAHRDGPPAAEPSAAEPSPGPLSPIDREIARSQRACAALAASAAVARAAFTDSQLEAEAAAAAAQAESDLDISPWVRTEYAALDDSVGGRAAAEERAARRAGASTHNPVAGTFDPGLVAINSRTFASASSSGRLGATMRTRSGAEARFRQESRQAPRGERGDPHASSGADADPRRAGPQSGYDKAELMPMLAPVPAARPRAAAAPAVARPVRRNDMSRMVIAGCLGAVAAVMAGGVAWRQGLLTPGGSPADRSVVTANVARQAEAARVLGAAEQELATSPPAAGVQAAPVAAAAPAAEASAPALMAPVKASPADVDAILAAAARVAPAGRTPAPAAETVVAEAHWSGPPAAPAVAKPAAVAVDPVARPQAAMPTAASASAAAPRDTPRSRQAVADAIADAQARADRFLSTSQQPKP